MTVQMTKSGFGMPTAISEIMRAKAAAAVAQIRKKESLLAGAVVAGSIALGGMNCANTATPEQDKEPHWVPVYTDSLDIFPPSDKKEKEKENISSSETCEAKTWDGTAVDCGNYTKYLGDIHLNAMVDSVTFAYEIGYCKVYSYRDWTGHGEGGTPVVIFLPNGEKYAYTMGYGIVNGTERFGTNSATGYNGILIISDGWRSPSTSIREPERKIPNQSGLGL